MSDQVILMLLIFILIRGWQKGFTRSLIGPLSCLIPFFIGIIFFDLNQNIVISALIVVLGTIIVATGATLMFTVSRLTVDKQYRGQLFLLSRFLGILINFLWQGNLLFLGIMLLAVLPPQIGGIQKIQDDILKSQTYHFCDQVLHDNNIALYNAFSTLAILKNPEDIQKLSYLGEFHDFVYDKKVNDLINDEKVQEIIDENKTWQMIIHPKLWILLTNGDSMMKFTRLCRKAYIETALAQEAKEYQHP